MIGRDGDFDLLASAAIKRVIRSYGYGNTHFTLVLPYMKAKYRDNEKEYLDYYDEVEVCAESSDAYPKSAIQVRNRSMIDRANIVIAVSNTKAAVLMQRYAMRRNRARR